MTLSAPILHEQNDPGILEMKLSDMRAIARMMEENTGNVFPETKHALIQSRVHKRMISRKIDNFKEYIAFLASPNGRREKEELIYTLTTNTTRFFRESHHFDNLRHNILPTLIARAKRGGRVRIWSAGCSSGEEPYSIAMLAILLEPDLGHYDFKILATDLDRNMVSHALRGQYPGDKLSTLPSDIQPLLTCHDDMLVMSDSMRKLISFRELNLLHEWPFKGHFDIIFCRNVLIYFNEDISDQLWSKFSARILPGGHMFIGHSERVRVPESIGLTLTGITTYEKKL